MKSKNVPCKILPQTKSSKWRFLIAKGQCYFNVTIGIDTYNIKWPKTFQKEPNSKLAMKFKNVPCKILLQTKSSKLRFLIAKDRCYFDVSYVIDIYNKKWPKACKKEPNAKLTMKSKYVPCKILPYTNSSILIFLFAKGRYYFNVTIVIDIYNKIWPKSCQKQPNSKLAMKSKNVTCKFLLQNKSSKLRFLISNGR